MHARTDSGGPPPIVLEKNSVTCISSDLLWETLTVVGSNSYSAEYDPSDSRQACNLQILPLSTKKGPCPFEVGYALVLDHPCVGDLGKAGSFNFNATTAGLCMRLCWCCISRR